MTSELRWCSNCVAMSTRPRITFDERGWCNACRWSEQKRSLDWDARQSQLETLLDRHRSSAAAFDCIVPVSGGKDGSYVAHTLKTRYGMNPLAVTVNPALPLPLGQRNLQAFADSGFTLLAVNPDPEAMRQLNRIGFEEMGFPYYGWLIAIHTAVIRVAKSFGIQLLFYGEDGEVEYGGSTETAHDPVYGMDYQRRVYLEGDTTGYSSAATSLLRRCTSSRSRPRRRLQASSSTSRTGRTSRTGIPTGTILSRRSIAASRRTRTRTPGRSRTSHRTTKRFMHSTRT